MYFIRKFNYWKTGGIMTFMQLLKNSGLLILLLTNLLFATALGDAVGKMKANSWRSLLTTGITDDMFKTGPVMDAIFAFSDNATWDPVSRQLLYLGCPHYAPWRFPVYKEETNGWRAEALPNPVMSQGGSVYIGHGYDHNTVDTKNGVFYTFNAQGDMYRFDTRANTWSTVSQKGTLPPHSFGMAFDYFPEMNKIVHAYGGTVSFFDLATETWSLKQSGVPMGGYHNMGEYDPIHHILVFGGGVGDNTLNKMDSLGNITQLKPPPLTIAIPTTIMTADPVTGTLLVLANKQFYAFNAAADEWSLISGDISTIAGLKTFAEGATVAAPISTWGVNAFISNYMYPVMLYRYSDPVAVEKPLPKAANSGLTLNASPNPFSTSVSLSWTASGSAKEAAGIAVYDLSGRKVADLSGRVTEGSTVTWQAGDLSQGIYIVRLTLGPLAVQKRVQLLR